MAIEFHCPYCEKGIRASDDTAGRWGKCPACHQRVYIPTPGDEVEPIGLEPIDPAAERERARLLRETKELQRKLLHDRESAPETGGAPHRAPEGVMPPTVDMDTIVIEYVLAMAAGELEEAQRLAGDIRRNIKRANDVIQKMMADEIPPARLAGIPRPVVVGFLKQLRA